MKRVWVFEWFFNLHKNKTKTKQTEPTDNLLVMTKITLKNNKTTYVISPLVSKLQSCVKGPKHDILVI